MVAAAKPVEPVEYPETDDMGEHEVQRFIALLLQMLVERLLRERRRVARVSGNQFVYWSEGDPSKARAPDLYVVDGVPQDAPDRGVWKTWEGTVPSFALEVVSADWKKDYAEAPGDYGVMGVRELVLFDPWATPRSRKRVRWQVYRRVRGRGFTLVESSMGDRVRSAALDAWLRVVDDAGRVRLRLALGPRGDELVPTDREVADAEATIRRIAEAQAEAERTARQAAEEHARSEQAARQAAEEHVRSEQAARAAAEAELARLREELERLRGGR